MKRNLFVSVCLALLIMGCEPEPEVFYSTVTFEDASGNNLAGSPYGENLYGGEYQGYYDEVSDLSIGLLSDNFYEGGIVLSQWNDTSTAGYMNQCSVFSKNESTGLGGNNGSRTFAVHYGCDNSSYLYGSDTRTFLGFHGESTEKVFDHFYVNNSTYVLLNMRDGDGVSSPLSYEDGDWFKLIITGIDVEGKETGEIVHYLADFRHNSSSGITTEWTKVDLYSLGLVHSLRFDLAGSNVNEYGTTIPAYFCFDDVAIRK